MEISDALTAFAALGHPTRLEVFRLLVRVGGDGLPAGEIGAALDVKPNTLSAQLAQLAQAGLVDQQRDGRLIRCRARMDGLGALVGFLMEECCGGDPKACSALIDDFLTKAERKAAMPNTPYNMLFLCTGNSARSILAEAILTREGGSRFRAFSAGSQPKSEVHPYALDLLRQLNHPTEFARSKSWGEFAAPEAPQMDFVVTVCDSAAAETCPIWPGQPISAHWGVPDPAAAKGSESERRLAFAEAYRMLSNRISTFVNLPIEGIDRLKLQKRMEEIGGRA